jgi:transposase
MLPESLFGAALNLPPPWYVKNTDFSLEAHEFTIYVDFEEGGRFPCPRCGALCPAYDTEARVWRHLNFAEHQVHLHARFPRVSCGEHGIHTVEAPWSRPGSGFTLQFEAFALSLAQKMSVLAVANLLGVNDERIWTIIKHYVGEAHQAQDLSDVTDIGVDEVARKRGQDYLSLCIDQAGRRVVAVAQGRSEQSIVDISHQLNDHGAAPEKIRSVSRDLASAYKTSVCL